MWYLAWKKTAVWGLKGLLLGGALYAVIAWVIPFAFKVLATAISALFAVIIIALCVGVVVVALRHAITLARR